MSTQNDTQAADGLGNIAKQPDRDGIHSFPPSEENRIDELDTIIDSLVYEQLEITATEIGWEKIGEEVDEAKAKLQRLITQEAVKLAQSAIYGTLPKGVDVTCARLLTEAQRLRLTTITKGKQ